MEAHKYRVLRTLLASKYVSHKYTFSSVQTWIGSDGYTVGCTVNPNP